MRVLIAHDKAVYSLRFSHDGRFLATAGGDETVRLWALDTLEKVGEWPGSATWCPIALSPDGLYLGRGGYGIRVWTIEGGEKPLIQSKAFTYAVAFSPDSAVFVAHGSSSEPLARWALPSGKPLPGGWGGTRESNQGQQFPTGGMACSPDGRLLATNFGVLGPRAYDPVLYLWDAATGEQVGALKSDFANAGPEVLCFSADSRLLAGTYGPALRVWDVPSAQEAFYCKVGTKHLKDVAFTPDGARLVAVSNDATVRLWDTGAWQECGRFDWKIGKLGAVAVAPDGGCMAAGGSTGKVVLWDPQW